MALSSDEFKNRVVAAGALHGAGMREIRDILGAFGTERTLAERIISGKKPQNKRNIRDLAEALEVPRAWFTEPDWRLLLVEAAEPPERAIERDLDAAVRPPDSTDPHSGASEPEARRQ